MTFLPIRCSSFRRTHLDTVGVAGVASSPRDLDDQVVADVFEVDADGEVGVSPIDDLRWPDVEGHDADQLQEGPFEEGLTAGVQQQGSKESTPRPSGAGRVHEVVTSRSAPK